MSLIEKITTKTGSTLAAAFIIIIVLVVTCWYIVKSTEDRVLNYSHLLLGLAIGWLLGHIISPYYSQEKEDFSVYVKAGVAFVSGYVLSNVNSGIRQG